MFHDVFKTFNNVDNLSPSSIQLMALKEGTDDDVDDEDNDNVDDSDGAMARVSVSETLVSIGQTI